jgi:hypothetical protein
VRGSARARPAQRDPLSFLRGVAERLGWYVSALRDPRNGAIFYVGKGKGGRVYHHAKEAKKVGGESAPKLKLGTIDEIRRAGLEVGSRSSPIGWKARNSPTKWKRQ